MTTGAAKATALDNCPFCGSDAETDLVQHTLGNVTVHFVRCGGSDCPAPPEVTGLTAEEAAAAWNTRAKPAGKEGTSGAQ